MKVAVFSDVHGNPWALDAVLAAAEREGVDEHWIVGDLVAHGPRPAETIRRLIDLPNSRVVRGNTDRYVLTGDLPPMIPALAAARSDDERQLLINAAASFAWTRGAITAVGGYAWLAALPLEQRVTLPDGTRVLLVHASPGLDDGHGIQESMTDKEVAALGIADAAAELIFVGHTHHPHDRSLAGVRMINLGSVSLPATDDHRAMWTLLSADQRGHTIDRRYAPYDLAEVRRDIDHQHHPGADWLKGRFPIASAVPR